MDKKKAVVPHWELWKSQKSTTWRQTPGARRKTSVTRDATNTSKDSKLGKWPHQCHWPDSRYHFSPGTHCHLNEVTFGLWSEELFSKWHKSCFEKRCNKKGSSMNKSHAKVQSQGRTHSEKATQKCQRLPTSTNRLHWTQERVSETHEGSNQHIYWVPNKPYRVTFLTRWSAYFLKQQRQIRRLPS